MDSQAGVAAADLQGPSSESRSISSTATKKISFSFGVKSRVQATTRVSAASTSGSSASSTASVVFAPFTLSPRSSNASTSGTAAIPPSAATAPSKQVPSIFFSSSSSSASHEDGSACGSAGRAARQVLSFDKYSGWEERSDTKKEKAPLVIPCLHPLKPLRRAPRDNKTTTKTSAPAEEAPVSTAEAAGNDSAKACSVQTAATDAVMMGGAVSLESRASEGGGDGGSSREEAALTMGWTEATAVITKSESATHGEREAKTVAERDKDAVRGHNSTRGGARATTDVEQSQTKEDNSGVPVVGGTLDDLRAGPPSQQQQQQQKDADATKQESDGQAPPVQQRQEERKKAVVQFGLIKRAAATNPGKPCRSPSSTPSGSCAASAATSETVSHPRIAAASDLAAAGTTDADDLAAQALIAEARGDNAAAAAAAWNGKEDAGGMVPILARNAELAALRRKFRQRVKPQQHQQSNQPQHHLEEEGRHEQQLQQKRVRGRGVFLRDKANMFYEGEGFATQGRGESRTSSSVAVDRRKTVNIVSPNRSETCPLREVAAVYPGRSSSSDAANSAPCVAAAAAGSGAAGDDDHEIKGLILRTSLGRVKSQNQAETPLSREEAEKELLRQELLLLPDAPNAYSTAYAAVPVEEFGIAMLRGMGYDPATAKQTAAAGEETSVKKRTYARAGLGSEVEMDRLWAEREKKLKEEAMKEKKKKLEEMQNSRYHR